MLKYARYDAIQLQSEIQTPLKAKITSQKAITKKKPSGESVARRSRHNLYKARAYQTGSYIASNK